MIIKSITIAGWRCFIDELHLGPFDDQLNVVHAPNGTGKTTIFQAVKFAFLDGHKSSSRDVEALRPWGRALTPRVIVEFAAKGIDYRISKNFLDSPKSLLERKEAGIFKKFAQGNQADEHVRKLVVEDPSSKRFDKPETWGLAQVLWAPQGSLDLGSLSGVLVDDIRSSLSQQVTGVGPYDKKIQERWDRYFTPGGKLKSGSQAPEITRIRRELMDLQSQLANWRREYDELDQEAAEVAELRKTSIQLSSEVVALETALANQEKKANEYEKLLTEKNRLQDHTNSLEAQYQTVDARISTILELQENLESTTNLLESYKTELPSKKEEAETAKKKAEEVLASLQTARQSKAQVETARHRASVARELLEAEKERTRVEKSLNDASQVETSLNSLVAERSTFHAPDHETLNAIRKIINERDQARLKLEASLISLEIIPEVSGTLEVVSGEEPGIVALESNTPLTVKGFPEVVAVLPGVARLRASGPTVSIDKTRKTLEEALASLEELTQPFGTTDLEQLEALEKRARELDSQIKDARNNLAHILDGDTVANLQGKRESLVTRISEILGENPDWEQSRPDAEELENQARTLEQNINKAIEDLENQRDEAQEHSMSAIAQVEKLGSLIEEKSASLADLKKKLQVQCADGKTLEERIQERSRIAMDWEAAKTKLQKALEDLCKLGDDPRPEVENLKSQLKTLRSQAEFARKQADIKTGSLAARTERAPYSRLAELEEKIAVLEAREQEEQLRVDAIKLLKEVVEQSRNEALDAVTVPVETRASEIFHAIADDRLGHVTLNANFQPVGVLPPVIDNQVEVTALSGGEKEQIYLATRLALAETLRKDDRQVVILDDILTATDSFRIQRVMNVFEEASKLLQIIILTCHPERYENLKKAKRFDLLALLS